MRAMLILFAFAVPALLAGCDLGPPKEAPSALEADELFFVEQYVRVAEARQLAAEGSRQADTRFARLASEIPLDSVIDVAERISRERPERWHPIFEEIDRRLRHP